MTFPRVSLGLCVPFLALCLLLATPAPAQAQAGNDPNEPALGSFLPAEPAGEAWPAPAEPGGPFAQLAPQASHMQLLGQLGGANGGLISSGNTLYLVVGPRLVVLNVANLGLPAVVGRTPMLFGAPTGIDLAGQAIYAAAGYNGLRVISVSDSAHPQEIGSCALAGFLTGVDVQGNYAYLTSFSEGLHVVQISNPQAPAEVGTLDTAGIARGLVISGTLAYVADDSQGLRIIDVSQPTKPKEIGSFVSGQQALAVAISGTLAYLSEGSAGVRIVSVSDPTHPTQVGRRDPSWNAGRIVLRGNLAYVSAYDAGVRMLNVSNPADPTEYNAFDDPAIIWVADFALAQNRFGFFSDSFGSVGILDLRDPRYPAFVSWIYQSLYANNLALQGSHAYVAGMDRGVAVVNIGNPTAPFTTTTENLSPLTTSVAVLDGWAYGTVSHDYTPMRYGVQALEMKSQGASLTKRNFLTLSQSVALDIAAAGNTAYVAGGGNGLHLLNLTNRAAPAYLKLLPVPGIILAVAVDGSTLYLANDANGLRTVSVSKLSTPTLLGLLDTPDSAKDVAVQGGFAYVADRSSGLHIIDAGDAAHLSEIGVFNTVGYAYGVAVSGQLAFVADGRLGVRVLDISDKAHPTEVGYFDTPGYAYKVAVQGDLVGVADQEGGLILLRYTGDLPRAPAVWLPRLARRGR